MKTRKVLSVLLAVVMMLGCVYLGDTTFVSADEDLGADNTIKVGTWDLTTIDGETISNKQEGVVSILVFAGLKTCSISRTSVKSLCNAQWINDERVRVVIVDTDSLELEKYKELVSGYNSEKAQFCYSTDSVMTGSNMMWNYVWSVWGPSKTSVNTPLTVIVDSNNKVRYCFEGMLLAKEIRPCVENLIGEKLEGADVSNSDEYTKVHIEGTFNEQYAQEVLEIVNETRAAGGLQPLTMDANLMEKAMERAAECAVFYGHTRPDNTSFSTVLDREYRLYSAENVAAGQLTPQGVMTGWINSPGHYANIMSEYATSIGIGSFTMDGVTYWAQLFSDHLDTEETSYEDVATKAAITTYLDNLGYVTLNYSEDVTVGKTTKTTLQCYNTLKTDVVAYEAVVDGVTYKSLNTDVVTVSADGALTGVSVGNAYVNIYINEKLIWTMTIKVKAGSVTMPSPTPSYDPGASDGPKVSDSPYSSKEPVYSHGPYASDEPLASQEPEPSSSPAAGETPNPSKEPEADVMKGDANCDKTITLADAQLTLKAALKIENLKGNGLKAADVDGKEGITLADAQLILKVALRIISFNEL